jgi:hypothetical protein
VDLISNSKFKVQPIIHPRINCGLMEKAAPQLRKRIYLQNILFLKGLSPIARNLFAGGLKQNESVLVEEWLNLELLGFDILVINN